MTPRVEDCWRPGYSAACHAFRAAAGDAGARLTSFLHPGDSSLSMDVAAFGAVRARRILFIVSGIHGLEGPTGSAAQLSWIVGGTRCPDDVAVVMVHAANPWGYANRSRLTEDNVDLNRNFVDFAAPLPENPDYPRVRAAFPFVQTDAAAMGAFLDFAAGFEAEVGPVRAAMGINGGQYVDPRGISFGGLGPTWSNRMLRAIVSDHAAGADRVALLDWHTGVGAFGDTAYLMMASGQDPLDQPAVGWWGRDTVLAWRRNAVDSAAEAADAGLWNRIPGQFRNALAGMVPHAEVTGATIEFGSFVEGDSWQDTVYDSWLHATGDRTSPAAEAMMTRMLGMYNPEDPDWRAMVVRQGQLITQSTIQGLADW